MKKNILVCLMTLAVFAAFGQSKEAEARKKAGEAIELMDSKQYDEAIKILKQCVKMQPDTHIYLYELGFAYYLKGDNKNALSYLKKTLATDDVSDQCYQLYGNVLDIAGDRDAAFKAYDEGLKKFPNSGRLYLEKGNMYYVKEDYNRAINLYEKGIEMDPMFPSNYYRAAMLYCNSDEEVWGMLYGELFMNLEPTTERATEISKLLYNTYSSEITFPTDSTGSVSFSKGSIEISDPTQLENLKLPFPMMAYEPVMAISIVGTKSINLESLDHIRESFLSTYYSMGHDKNYPNALFDHQQKIKDAGHFEAYNFWLLSEGNPEEFQKWYDTNGEKWKAFAQWFNDNPLQLTEKNHFYRGQY